MSLVRQTKPASRSIALTEVMEWREGHARKFVDSLAAEEPLEIRVRFGDGASTPLSVTMRTPGNDLELAAGFLLTEGIIATPAQLGSMRVLTNENTGKENVVEVVILGREYDPESMQRNFFAASSCGVCGKASIDAIRRRELGRPNESFRITAEVLCSLTDKLRESQAVFSRTGGLHAAGLFSKAGELLEVREDIGRHNAVDKIVGWALREGRLPLAEHVLLVSGRGGFEIAQKAVAAAIPVLASVSAPSSLAVQLSRELGLTLIGFLRGQRFVIYSGAERCLMSRPEE